MKYIKSFSLFIAIGLFFMACETEIIDKVDTFNLPNGGYMRIVSPFPPAGQSFNTIFKVSKKNMAGTKLELVHEAVTPNKGANFDNYDTQIRYVGATAATSTTPVPFRNIPASAYTPDPTTGYPRHTFIVTGAEALAATKLDTSKITAGRWFEITATMRLKDGRSFNASNTGVNITGGAFYSSPFVYRINIEN